MNNFLYRLIEEIKTENERNFERYAKQKYE